MKDTVVSEIFSKEFPKESDSPIPTMECSMENECTVPPGVQGDIYLKVFNSAGASNHDPIIVNMGDNQYYEPDCDYYEVNCMCTAYPCACSLYLFPKLGTYSMIKLKKVTTSPKDANLLREVYSMGKG